MDSLKRVRSCRSSSSAVRTLSPHNRSTLARSARYSDTTSIRLNPELSRAIACSFEAWSRPALSVPPPPCPFDFSACCSELCEETMSRAVTRRMSSAWSRRAITSIADPGARLRANCSHSARIGSTFAKMNSPSRMWATYLAHLGESSGTGSGGAWRLATAGSEAVRA